ncbi:MAG: (2Fe-2S)-binding protein [Chloroflexi bacterium]|nr:(2Fe-2S)-binding protein [Chloroflexota bacterium]
MVARRLSGVDRGYSFTLTVDGQPVRAYAGESLAAALMAAGFRAFRRAVSGNAPRGVFCGMGMCVERWNVEVPAHKHSGLQP